MSFLKGQPHKLHNKLKKKARISKLSASDLKAILSETIYYLFAHPFGSK